ncbi:DUF2459 domain-containing protein [Candidatus Uabimicrobium amorphum]|uniref:DUF2459 domain-containing protein n=1 Tax=Uabimicrobium amorphum TaxID=2596890 RepID=A0A5S9IVV5_UABAM|nr:DUF2459 domain-containing protein [Candidatus Uabimicrobium amorphum]BBM88222.1 hypothetical protein UABAM_06643 [Candidatus Uabimicrobium amorphum]
MRKLWKYMKIAMLVFFLPIVTYLAIAVVCTYITVNNQEISDATHEIFISSNGVHLDIVLNKKDLSKGFLKGIVHYTHEDYLAFGWGDEDFYLNTPTWNDLSVANALQALFWHSDSLVHVTRYHYPQKHWAKVRVTKQQLQSVIQQIESAFLLKNEQKEVLQRSYHFYDNFYKAKGSYTCFYTCNTWVNCVLKNSAIKACLWTPFSFRLMDIHLNLSKEK